MLKHSLMNLPALALALFITQPVFGATKSNAVSEKSCNAVWIEEHWNVKPDKIDSFVDIYKNQIIPVLAEAKGYAGYEIVSTTPSPEVPTMDFAGSSLQLGPPDNMFAPHPGLNINGVRTNYMVHLETLLKGQFNIIIIHKIDTWKNFETWIPEFEAIWSKRHDGRNMWEDLQKDFFPMAINHWDTVYRVVDCSAKP